MKKHISSLSALPGPCLRHPTALPCPAMAPDGSIAWLAPPEMPSAHGYGYLQLPCSCLGVWPGSAQPSTLMGPSTLSWRQQPWALCPGAGSSSPAAMRGAAVGRGEARSPSFWVTGTGAGPQLRDWPPLQRGKCRELLSLVCRTASNLQ